MSSQLRAAPSNHNPEEAGLQLRSGDEPGSGRAGFPPIQPIRRRRGKAPTNEERGEGRGLSAMNGAGESDGGGYKRRCRALKRRLKLLLYEQECFQEELRRAQRKLLKVSRDKSFLLDRLLQYENVDDDSSDSEATASSDNSDGDGAKGAEPAPAKRRRSPSPPPPSFGPSPYLMASPPFPPAFPPLPPQGGARPRPSPARRSKGTRRGQAPPPAPPPLPFAGGGAGAGLSGGRGPGSPLPPPAPAPPPAPPPVPPTLPRRLLSREGEGEGEGSDDPLDGDDELVIDLPE